MRGQKDRHEASKESIVKHETSPVGDYLTPSNVTQAAVYKERWREQLTHTKKKVFHFQSFLIVF